MDIQDVLLMLIIAIGTAGAVALFRLRARVKPGRKWRTWHVFTLAFLWVFVVSDVAEHLNRIYDPRDGRGTMFARAFLLIGIALVVYLRVSERVPVSSLRVRDKEMQQKEGEDI